MEFDGDNTKLSIVSDSQSRSSSCFGLPTQNVTTTSTGAIIPTTATTTTNGPNTTNANEVIISNKSTWTVGKELEIELGRGVSEEDTLLARCDKNAVDFVFSYSKLWCKSCKDLVMSMEKRATSENDSTRAIMKQFQFLESSISGLNGAPFKKQTISLSRMLIDHCKEIENNNLKRCRELLEVLNRQRTLFEKTRKYLKDKWKTDVKRMLDAENSLIKTKAAYYQRCQAGVKLREELATAQNFLNELISSTSQNLLSTTSNPVSTSSTASNSTTIGSNSICPSSVTTGNTSVNTSGGSFAGSSASLTQDPSDTTTDPNASSVSSSSSNQIAKQRSKVERLEKQLSDNDKKEFEMMYSYREAVDIANHRLCELEKSKVEILCDIRLTITKSDEVVKDSVAELLNHLYTTRLVMIKQYETVANSFQDYIPCSDYKALVESHIQKGTEFALEKYHFDGFHESSLTNLKLDSSGGRIVGRFSGSGKDANDSDPFSHRNLLTTVHSDSESDCETNVELAASNASSNRSGGGIVSTSSNVLSTLVEFGSNLFRPDSKKSIRMKKSTSSANTIQSNTTDSLEAIAAQEALLEKEYLAACYPMARCIAAIEKQDGGLATHGIYRVPASKAKVTSLMDLLQSNHPTTMDEVEKDIEILSQEHALTLASVVKSQLIGLPEPLLTYNLYPNFVELGKACHLADSVVTDELMKRLQLLVKHLSPGNRQLAGLIFHHLHRVSECQSENQMGSTNLGTMFAPTVLRQRPKFQVANMMEFVDNKGQTKVVELLIDRVVQIFGLPNQYDPIQMILSPDLSDDTTKGLRPEFDRITIGRGSFSNTGDERAKYVTANIDDLFEQSNNNNQNLKADSNKQTTTQTQPSSLLRSATISAGNAGRPTAGTLLSGALPLYTPFRANSTQLNKDSMTDTSVSVTKETQKGSCIPNYSSNECKLQSEIKSDYSASKQSNVPAFSANRNLVKLQDLARTCDNVTSSAGLNSSIVTTTSTSTFTLTTTTTTTTIPNETSSLVRNIKKMCPTLSTSSGTTNTTAGTTATTITLTTTVTSAPITSTTSHLSIIPTVSGSSISSKLHSTIGLHEKNFAQKISSNILGSHDSPSNSALSSLVITKRKPLTKILTLSHPTEQNEPVSKNPIDLDQYSFIDNESPDSPGQ